MKHHSNQPVWTLRPIVALTLGVLSSMAFAAEPEPTGTATLEEVVVTSTPTIKPNTVKLDPKAPVQPIPAPDGASLLKTVPNMTVIRKGGIDGDPLFRGLGGSRLAITADDHQLFGGCGMRMDPPTSYIYPDNYDEVIITKGPQSVTQGPGLVAGSVQFIRHDVNEDQYGLHGNGSFTVGSADRLDGNLGVSGTWKYGYVRLNAAGNKADNYKDGDGKEVHSNYSRNSQNLSIGITPDDKTLIEAGFDRSRGEAAYADRGMDGVKFDRDAWNVKVARRQITPWLSEIKAQYGHSYVDHVMDNFTLANKTAMMMMGKYSVKNPDRETDTAKLEATLDFAQVRAKIGADWMEDQHSMRGSDPSNSSLIANTQYLNKHRINDQYFKNYGIYAEATWQMSDKNRLIAGLRRDKTKAEYETGYAGFANVNGTAWQKQTYNLNAGFARFEHQRNDWTYYAGVGLADRAPDYWERNRSAKLNKESNRQLDLGAIYKRDNLQVSTSLFASKINDFILVDTTVPAGQPTARNIDAKRWGGEVEAMWNFAPSWKAGTSLAYTWGKNSTNGTALAQTPPLESKTTVGYDNGKFSASALLRVVAKQNRFVMGQGNIAGQDSGASAGFAVLSLNAGWKINKNMVLTAGVDNVFDRTYSELINNKESYNDDGGASLRKINEPGRQYWLKVNAKF